MQEREYKFLLEDILQAIQKIENYLKDLSFDEFLNNEMAIDAVIRNFEIIGEAANKIPETICKDYPQIPWTKMYRLRNIVIHHYHGIDYEMIWEISLNHLPKNKIDLMKILDIEKTKS